MLSVATDAQAQDELRLDLDELVREGARRMLAAALEAEVDDYLAAHLAEHSTATEVLPIPPIPVNTTRRTVALGV
jgi:putative transposase